jgi:hypothetical protein
MGKKVLAPSAPKILRQGREMKEEQEEGDGAYEQ